MHLDYAEEQAERRQPLYMLDWRAKLDAFLAFTERDVLKDAGRVSMEIAQRLALDEYDKFVTRRLAEEAAVPDELEASVNRLAPGKSRKGRKR